MPSSESDHAGGIQELPINVFWRHCYSILLLDKWQINRAQNCVFSSSKFSENNFIAINLALLAFLKGSLWVFAEFYLPYLPCMGSSSPGLSVGSFQLRQRWMRSTGCGARALGCPQLHLHCFPQMGNINKSLRTERKIIFRFSASNSQNPGQTMWHEEQKKLGKRAIVGQGALSFSVTKKKKKKRSLSFFYRPWWL